MDLGEEYLDTPHDDDNHEIASAYNDPLKDIIPP